MKKHNEKTELIYKTNIKEGLIPFDGKPSASKEVLDMIGQEGVNFIHNTLKLFRETKRKMFGNQDNKVFFHEKQFFQVVGIMKSIKVTPIKDNTEGDYRLTLSDSLTTYKRRKEVIEAMQIPISLTIKEEREYHFKKCSKYSFGNCNYQATIK